MNKNKTYLHVAVALVLGLLIGFGVQPENGLTVLGVRVLAVTIPTLYLWLTVNTSWCALLFLALLILTGAMTPTEVWAGSMGHFAVITMIVFSILNYALKETGVIDRAAAWFVSRRIAKGRPLVFLGLFFLSNLIIGMFVDNLSLAIIYVGLAIARTGGQDWRKKGRFVLRLSVYRHSVVQCDHFNRFADRTCTGTHSHRHDRNAAWHYDFVCQVAVCGCAVCGSHVPCDDGGGGCMATGCQSLSGL